MSSNTTGYASLAVLGTVIVSLIAGGYYYANSESEPYGRPTGMPYQQGGKKSRRKHNRVRKTRRNLH